MNIKFYKGCSLDGTIAYALFLFGNQDTLFQRIVSTPKCGNYSSFHYIRENLMWKLYEIFKVLKIQKIIVSAEL